MADLDPEKKSGERLYREVKRLFPSACLDSYYQNGTWRKDLLAIDIELVEAHRREAYAPEPPPLDLSELLPELELLTGRARPKELPPKEGPKERQPIRALATTVMRSSLTPTEPSKPPPKALLGRGPALVAARPAFNASALSDFNAFVEKWHLEPVKARLAISPIPPSARPRVYQEFRPSSAKGLTIYAQLDQLIAKVKTTLQASSVGKPSAEPYRNLAGPSRMAPKTPPRGSSAPSPPKYALPTPSATPTLSRLLPQAAAASWKPPARPSATSRVASMAAPAAPKVASSVKRPLSAVSNGFARPVEPEPKRLRPQGSVAAVIAAGKAPSRVAAIGKASQPTASYLQPTAKSKSAAVAEPAVRTLRPVQYGAAKAPATAPASDTNLRPGALIRSLLGSI